MTSVIVDLDVLADSRWRDDLRPTAGIGDWDVYHAEMTKDRLNLHAFILVDGLIRMGVYATVVTHRPWKWREAIQAWMVKHNVRADKLVCRADHNFNANPEALADLIEGESRSDFVILGDDERIADAVRAMGVYVIQAHRP